MFLILLPASVAFALLAFSMFRNLRSMEMHVGLGVILSRWESPLLFWLMIILKFSVLAAVLALIYWTVFILPYIKGS